MNKPVQSKKDGRTKAEADKAYRELEKKILETNRLADERKAKPTSFAKSAFHKTTCRHCGVHIEYPSEAEGQMAQCPKCGRNVILVVLSKGGANGQKTAMKQVLQNDDYATEPKTPQRREGTTFNSTALPASKSFKNDAPYSTPSNFFNFDQSKAAKAKSTDGGVGGWIATVIGGIVFLCIVLWLNPSLYRSDKAAIIGTINSQPYRLAIDNYLRAHANDPSSVEIDNLSTPQALNNGHRIVHCTYRAKNGFGALVLSQGDVEIDGDGNVFDMWTPTLR